MEMPPPPPVQPPKSNSSSLISAIHEEVEQKLEKQKEENRDVMEIVTVEEVERSYEQNKQDAPSEEQKRQSEHFDSTVSDMYPDSGRFTSRRQFSQSWSLYCNETIEKLLDVDVDLSCLENRLLFCYDSTIEKRIAQMQKQFDAIGSIQRLVTIHSSSQLSEPSPTNSPVCSYERNHHLVIHCFLFLFDSFSFGSLFP